MLRTLGTTRPHRQQTANGASKLLRDAAHLIGEERVTQKAALDSASS